MVKRRRKVALLAAIAAVATLGAAALVWAPTAHADLNGLAFTPRSAHSITNEEYASCMDVDVNRMLDNGGRVQLYKCHGRQNQLWSVQPAGRYYTIRLHGHPNRCLEAETGLMPSNNTPVHLWDCNGSDQQLWIITRVALMNRFQEMSDGFIDRAFKIRNVAGNRKMAEAGLLEAEDLVLAVVESTVAYQGGGGIIVDVPREFRRADLAMQRTTAGLPVPNGVWESPALTCVVYGTDATRITGEFGSALCPGLPTST